MRGVTSSVAAALAPQSAVAVCLLGGFRLLKGSRVVPVRPRGKVQAVLSNLALRPGAGMAREELLELVWPTIDFLLASQSLNTLVSSLHRMLGDALDGRSPVTHSSGWYRLNEEGGVGIDIVWFDEAVAEGDRRSRLGDDAAATAAYGRALDVYQGDLMLDTAVDHMVERERLRARYLSLRARIADHAFASGDYSAALEDALSLLAHDPCREDAHRMAMRSYVRLEQRAQALRQYRICREILDKEFDARPEPLTEALFELVRLRPAEV
jgi:DNA-binding SARP family transcriptional activator